MMLQKYFRVQFLGPLIKAMTHKDPKSRPTAEEAAEQWRQIRKRVLLFQRACRLRGREGNFFEALVLDIISVLKVGYLIARRFAGWSLVWLSMIC